MTGLAGIVSRITAIRQKHFTSSDHYGDFATLKGLFEIGDLNQFNAHVAGPVPVLAANTFNAYPLVLSM